MINRPRRCSLALMVTVFAGCAELRPPEMVRTIDHASGEWENADLWRRVKDDPAIYHPRALPTGSTISPETGDWLVDPQDQAAFFVPNSSVDGLTSSMWRSEARKAINLPRGEQTDVNMRKVLVGWPAYLSLSTLQSIGKGVVGSDWNTPAIDIDPSKIKAPEMKMKSGGMNSSGGGRSGGGRR